MTTVVVAGYLVRHPIGGNAWTFAQYVAGLARLGVAVAYVEESGWQQPCFDPRSGRYGDDPGTGLQIARRLLARLGVDVPMLYVDRRTGAVFGGDRPTLEWWLARCDVVLDVGGVCDLPEFDLAARRVLVDLDPGFTQAGRFAGDLGRYDAHFTYGLNLGRDGCAIPTQGITWHPTVPPVIGDAWARTDHVGGHPTRFTTVASWDAYGSVVIGGRELGQKRTQLRRLVDLPARCGHRLEVALAGAPDDVVAELRRGGWLVRSTDGLRDVDAYRRYVRQSGGEFSVAKQVYVETRSGWVSDRTACYLAAGRPAVVEDTGIGDALPLGDGLLTFRDLPEAAAALDEVLSAPARHARAARALADDVFDARRVLASLLDRSVAHARGGRTERK